MADQSEPKQYSVNSWLEDELYQTYLHDRRNVDETWKTVFEGNGHTAAPAPVKTSNGTASSAPAGSQAPQPPLNATDQLQPMRGVASKIAENMTASLAVPTATSQRLVPVKGLESARSAINKQREQAGQSKLSYTHLISWAILKALRDFPQINDAYTEQDNQPFRVVRKEINFGLAVDVKAKDGSSSLMVPNVKNAGNLSFEQFLTAFDDIVARARSGKLQMPDFQGTSISLTNPGTVGTFGSVPRLVAGQGAIIATGAMDYPAEFATVPETKRAELGLSKVMMVTCTYDHRIIQGAESGRFLAKLHALLNGQDDFYEEIYGALHVAAPQKVSAPAPPPADVQAPAAISVSDAIKEAAVAHLINAYRVRGHLIADLDPLGSTRPMHPDLDPVTHGLTDADLDRPFASVWGKTLRHVLAELKQTYCSKLTCEYMYIPVPEQKNWLRERMESTQNNWPLTNEKRSSILDWLIHAEEFERFLHTRFIGKKRFSLEGGEAAVAALDEILDRSADGEVEEVVIGMAHRGRLNILANIVGKPVHQVFSEFEEAPDASSHVSGLGDVKYHLGASGFHKSDRGNEVAVSVAFNPSHLEAVDPVVEGIVRQKQDALGDSARERILPVLIHGDAAFAGQGVVPETLNLSQLEGYATGGTLHVVVNNQLGFTTPPDEGRSGYYCTDIAKSIHAPVIHVNADDPDAVVRAAQLAYDFRQQFKRDVVLDIVCYRRYGHNEGDDPTYTQPVMYNRIKAQPSVTKQYAEKLDREGLVTLAETDQRRKAYVKKLADAYDLMKQNAEEHEAHYETLAPAETQPVHTAIDREAANQVIDGLTSLPAGFRLHPKLKGFLDNRRKILDGAPFDWAAGEAMAFGSLLLEGFNVRLSGQDSGRGTFSQRHLELYDSEDGHKYVPLKHISPEQARFEVYDSSLSEYAVMGFEFGYSLADPRTLVLWEAQFGDFVNGAQIIVDQFITSAETKWGTHSGMVLLLPHGYEGMGPEHSSARIERFLQLCAENNSIVANCTTPAQYFHILRRQMVGDNGKPVRKPLILFTPKSILRHPKAVSTLDDVLNGTFREVLPDTGAAAPKDIKRVLFCSGKIYYELLAAREQKKADHVAMVRVEQMYPFPKTAIDQVLATYGPKTEVYWVQEESRNMGPWRFMHECMQPLLDGTKRTLFCAARAESSSPSPGSSKRDAKEQGEVIDDAFGARPVTRRPRRVKVVKKK